MSSENHTRLLGQPQSRLYHCLRGPCLCYMNRTDTPWPGPGFPEPVVCIWDQKPKVPDFIGVYNLFLRECGEKNAWTKATYDKMKAMRRDLVAFKKDIFFSDLTEATLTEFVAYLRDEKVLHCPRKKKGERKKYDKDDLVGLKNSSIDKKLGYLRWFLN